MLTIDSIILYVEDIKISQKFYENILTCKVSELPPTFVSFNLVNGSMLELKQRDQAMPYSDVKGGGTELSIAVSNHDALMSLYNNWHHQSVQVMQPPTRLVFGMTFVVVDPDNHRIRVFIANDMSL